MKRVPVAAGIVVAFGLLGCTKPAEEPVQAAPPVAEAAPAAVIVTDPNAPLLPSGYLAAAAAMAADDFAAAKTSLTALVRESSGEFQTLAQTAADTSDMAAMRESFKPLSELAATMKLPEGYAVAFCPMYKGGAKWVQKRETLANPYFGKAMLTCGNFIN
jgi:hypothetical protein